MDIDVLANTGSKTTMLVTFKVPSDLPSGYEWDEQQVCKTTITAVRIDIRFYTTRQRNSELLVTSSVLEVPSIWESDTMNNTNNPSRTNKSSSFVHQRWGNAYGRVWRFSCARYDTQLLRSNITVGREANIHGNYWIDRPIIVVVRPSCSEENITN